MDSAKRITQPSWASIFESVRPYSSKIIDNFLNSEYLPLFLHHRPLVSMGGQKIMGNSDRREGRIRIGKHFHS